MNLSVDEIKHYSFPGAGFDVLLLDVLEGRVSVQAEAAGFRLPAKAYGKGVHRVYLRNKPALFHLQV